MIIAVENLRALCQSVLMDRGLDEADAHVVTDILIEAELRGRATHGMIRLPGIVERVSRGAQVPMVAVKEAGAYALIDGRDNLGYLVAHRCARIAIDKAKQSGVGVVGARNTSHSGMLGYYASMIADAGLVGLAMCNTGPRIVPWGGREPVLGTNPIAAGFPSAEGQVLVDFSCAAITNGEILVALNDGKAIPAGRALGPDGEPTTDPERARRGGALPFGEHKGYALAVLIQLFTGALLTADPVPEMGGHYGIFALGIDPSIFLGIDAFRRGVDEVVCAVKNALPADGVTEILAPGERAFRERAARIRSGIAMGDEVMAELERLLSASGDAQRI